MRPEELGLHAERDADGALLAAVRPAAWKNPAPRERYHLVVIGGGTGGLVTAAAATSLGARVALVERRLLGGDCLNVGCVPSKGVIAGARAWHDAARSSAHFGAPVPAGDGDVRVIMERMRRIRAAIAPHDGAERFAGLGVDVFFGDGRFVSRREVEVDGARLRFRRAVIATGTRPVIPGIPGLAESAPLTNETVFALDTVPERLAVIGGGPIGCEMAQAFARLGSRVTLIEAEDRLLRQEDPEGVAVIGEALRRDGIDLLLGARVDSVTLSGAVRTLAVASGGGERVITSDAILVAAGRAPNVEDLGLDAARVSFGPSGVDVDRRLRTSNPRIYAVGDVTGLQRFTHLADAHARLVVANALFFGRGRTTSLVVPRCTYTDPELAHVGLTAAEATQSNLRLDTIEVPLATVDRAQLDGEAEGLLRVHLKAGSDRILGATLVARRAGDMLGELALAMTAGAGLATVGRTIHAYPTQAEIFRKAADAWRRRKLTPRARRFLGWYFRVFR